MQSGAEVWMASDTSAHLGRALKSLDKALTTPYVTTSTGAETSIRLWY